MDTNTAHIRRVDRSQDSTSMVALDRLRRCPNEVKDEFWPPDKQRTRITHRGSSGGAEASSHHKRVADQLENPSAQKNSQNDDGMVARPLPSDPPRMDTGKDANERNMRTENSPLTAPPSMSSTPRPSKWAGRLRGHKKSARTPAANRGEM